MPILALILAYLGLEGLILWGVATLLDSWPFAIYLAIGTSFVGGWQLGRARQGLDPEAVQRAMLQGGGLAQGLVGQFAPMAAGVLLLLPGLLTDVLGASLLIPATRKLWTPIILFLVQKGVRAAASGKFGPLNHPGAGPGGQVHPEQLRQFEAMLKGGGGFPPGGMPGGMPGSMPRGNRGGRATSRVQRRGREKVRDADFEVLDD